MGGKKTNGSDGGFVIEKEQNIPQMEFQLNNQWGNDINVMFQSWRFQLFETFVGKKKLSQKIIQKINLKLCK